MDRVAQAFQKIHRADFLPEELRYKAIVDRPVPIGFGQTNSQPSTVEQMLRWLEAEPGNKALDIGSGSGWTTALLSEIVGPSGRVYAVEKIPELVEFGRQNCERIHIKNVRFFEAGKTLGLPKQAPYDRILVSASANELPETLLDQLTLGGKIIIPVKNDILEITKTASNRFETNAHRGFVFVPLAQ